MSRSRWTTIRDIARHLDLSPATVSTALTGRRTGTHVSDETRELVRQTARQMGYPLERLRARYRQLQRVALFCPASRQALYYGTALEVIRLLSQQGVSVFVNMEQDPRDACAWIGEIRQRRSVDAAVLVGSRVTPEELPDTDLPFVVIGDVPDGVHCWRVGVDNEAGGRAVGQHLWHLGHRRVAWVATTDNPVINGRRLSGLRAVWREHGCDLPDEWVLPLDGRDKEELAALLPPWLEAADRRGQRPTALALYNDILAAVALKTLGRLGLRVPEDISVVGFDDSVFAVWLTPPLTTVRQPFDQMGALAAQLIQERVAAPDQPPREHVLLCPLIVRDSTGPAPELGNGVELQAAGSVGSSAGEGGGKGGQ